MIHNPDWRTRLTRPNELVSLVTSRPLVTFHTMWEETTDPEWMVYLAEAGGATCRQFATTVCEIARLFLPMIQDRGPHITLETAEAYLRGECTKEQVERTFPTSPTTLVMSDDFLDAISGRTTADSVVYFAVNVSKWALTTTSFANENSSILVSFAIEAGVDRLTLCKTFRLHLPFERPKRMTVWQRLCLD